MVDRKIETSSGAIAARVWNEGGAKKVLALHGWLDNAASFDNLAPLLPSNWEIVAVDLPGHGFSFHRKEDRGYPFIEWISYVREIIQSLKWKRFTFLGHSLGGGISVIYAGLYPEQIDRVWLVESLGPLALPAATAPERMKAFLDEWDRAKKGRAPVYSSIEEVVKLRVRATKMAPESARVILERSLKPVEGGLSWRSDHTLLLPSPLRLVPEQVHAFLKRITAPTLVIRAEDGMKYDPLDAQARVQAIARIKVVTVPGGHHVHMDHPERVANVLKQELA